jgi:F-type H+-transporting ATPase subunit a
MNPMEQFAAGPALVPLHIGSFDVSFTKESMWMVIVVGAITLFMAMAVSKRSLIPSRMQSMAEISYEFVANMIGGAAGEDGLRFFPMVFTFFMFILFSNFLGLLPHSFTVTSQIAVTFAMAAVVISVVIVTGFVKHGFGFLKLFVPQAPWWILWLLVPIEVVSFLIRPMSLSVRLFANMLAGHTMLKVFAGFVIALGGAGALAPLAIAPMFMIVAITGLELLIAFLQAYVFAMLTCIYLNEALHLHGH